MVYRLIKHAGWWENTRGIRDLGIFLVFLQDPALFISLETIL